MAHMRSANPSGLMSLIMPSKTARCLCTSGLGIGEIKAELKNREPCQINHLDWNLLYHLNISCD